MSEKINYKKECLVINPNLKAAKVKGCAFYHIIVGGRHSHTTFSEFKDTIGQAWKDCYERLKK